MTTPLEILEDAEQLGEKSPDPARQRTVISRSYYAAYHHVRLHNRARAYRYSRRGGMHKEFLDFLDRSADRDLQWAGSRLNDLYSLRLLADYRLEHPLPPNAAGRCLEDAREIIEDILAVEE